MDKIAYIKRLICDKNVNAGFRLDMGIASTQHIWALGGQKRGGGQQVAHNVITYKVADALIFIIIISRAPS